VSIIFLTGAMQEMHGLGSELGQAWLACTGMASSYPGPVNSGERLNLFFSPIAVQWIYPLLDPGVGCLCGPELPWLCLREGPPIQR
jgi:hypothetical protein